MATQIQSLTVPVACTRCGTAIPLADAAQHYGALCPGCGAVTTITLFPAAFQAPEPVVAEPITESDEASCFSHLGKRARAACGICGRFVCALCQIDVDGQTLCPLCVERGRLSRTIERLETRRVLYDNIALGAATIPALLIWPTIFSAPATLFVAIRYWRAPGSLVRHSRIRFWLAIVLALIEIAAIVALVVILVKTRAYFP